MTAIALMLAINISAGAQTRPQPARTPATTTMKEQQKPFVAVTSISGVPTTAKAGTPLTLTGTVNPATATNKTITWSVTSAGTTGAKISGNTLTTTAAGTVTVLATVKNGQSATADYVQKIAITVGAADADVAGTTGSE